MPGLFGRRSGPEPQENLDPGDRRLIEYLRSHGANLELPRETRHWIYFSSREAAETAARRLAQAGYSVDVAPSPQKTGNEWRVLATGMDVVKPATFAQVRQFMEELASRGEGEYDGWEASIKP